MPNAIEGRSTDAYGIVTSTTSHDLPPQMSRAEPRISGFQRAADSASIIKYPLSELSGGSFCLLRSAFVHCVEAAVIVHGSASVCHPTLSLARMINRAVAAQLKLFAAGYQAD